MIGSLRGKIIEKEENRAIVEIGGVGYEVNLPLPVALELKKDSPVFLYIVDVVREDSRELYGFPDIDSRSLFRKLIAISGVGPRSALHILSLGPLEGVKKAIEDSDISRLTSMPGIGKKLAQKIILELKGKLATEEATADQDVVEALLGLGYSRSEARKAVSSMPATAETTEEKILAALKQLGKK